MNCTLIVQQEHHEHIFNKNILFLQEHNHLFINIYNLIKIKYFKVN